MLFVSDLRWTMYSLVRARARRRKAVLARVDSQRPYRLLVVRESCHTLTRRKIPKPDSAVHASRNDLRLRCLAFHRGNGARVSGQSEDVGARPHVPDPHTRITTSRRQDIQSGVNIQRIDARVVAVVLPDDLVRLEIPTLDHLVFTCGE